MTITELKRSNFNVIETTSTTVKTKEVRGYEFVLIGEEYAWQIGVCKIGRAWKLYDVWTGILLHDGGWSTRREAVEYAESDELARNFENLMANRPALYLAKIVVLRKLVEEGSMSLSEFMVLISETAAMIEEGTVQVERPTVDVPEPEPEATAMPEIAAEVTLETMKAAVAAWDNVAVTQKNPQSLIWVHGDTAEHAEELTTMGFGRSKEKGGWWIKPTAATW